MRFDGRSWITEPLRYSMRERLIVGIATRAMPVVSRLLLSPRLNTWVWKLLGCRVGVGSVIRTGTQINVPFQVEMGRDCLIHGQLKSRGGVRIGDGVELVEDVLISTQSHNADSPLFESEYRPVVVEDRCWIGPRAVVLPGVRLREGSMIGAGAVVTKDTEAWSVYAGVPAKRLKARQPLKTPDSDAIDL